MTHFPRGRSHRAAHAARLFFLPALLLATACSGGVGEPLPRLEIEPGRVAFTGLSAGAYMAAQSHLALADRVDGVALVAGGPPGCAEGKLETDAGPRIARPLHRRAAAGTRCAGTAASCPRTRRRWPRRAVVGLGR